MAWRKDPSLNQTITKKITFEDADSDTTFSVPQTTTGVIVNDPLFPPRNSSTVLAGNPLKGGANNPFFTVPANQRYKVRIAGGNYTSRHDASLNSTNYLGVDLYLGDALLSFVYFAKMFSNPTTYVNYPFLIPNGIDYWIEPGDKIYADTFPAGWNPNPMPLLDFANTYFHFEFSFQLIGYTDQ